MERHLNHRIERKSAMQHPLDQESFRPGPGQTTSELLSELAEYEARLERAWKRAALRTEQALRMPSEHRYLAGPDGTF